MESGTQRAAWRVRVARATGERACLAWTAGEFPPLRGSQCHARGLFVSGRGSGPAAFLRLTGYGRDSPAAR